MKTLQNLLCRITPNAYYVGGVVRDSFLKRYSGDIDLAMPKEEVKPAAVKLAQALNATAFEMDAEFGVWRVHSKNGLQVDLCSFIGKDIEEDLKRRDFTINALAYPVSALPEIKTKKNGKKTEVLLTNLKKQQLLDLNGGLADIKAKTVKCNAPDVFKKDPLRLLRAFRTCAELNFKAEGITLAKIKKNAALVNNPAGERIQEELKRILACQGARQMLELMDKTGVLKSLFPILEEQKKCAVCYYGKGGVFTHTMAVVERIEYLLLNLKTAFPKLYKKLQAHPLDPALYKTAALLHDIAKPATAKMMDGRLRFFYHEEQGATMAEEILRKLKYSNEEIKLITKMIEFHLRPSNLASNEIITDKGIYKFFKELGPAGVPMLLLCWADYTSYITPKEMKALIKKSANPIITIEEGKQKGSLGKTLRHMQVVNFLLGKYFNEAKKIILPRKLIDGKDIMAVLKIPSGRKVGEILEHLTLVQIEGKVQDRQEALAYLLKHKAELIK
jgi:poly(A) polymerase